LARYRTGRTGVVERERAPLNVVRFELLAAGAFDQVVHRPDQVRKTALIRIFDDRDDQAIGDRHRDAHVTLWASSVPPGRRKRLPVETTNHAFAYVFAGSGTFRDASNPRAVLTEQVETPDAPPMYDVSNHSLVLFDRGDELTVQAGPEGIRFLLVSGKPIEEPVAWYGPFVMNTHEELAQAFDDFRRGRMGTIPAVHIGR